MGAELGLMRYTRNCVFLHKLRGGDWYPRLLVVRKLMPQQYDRQRWTIILHTDITLISSQIICLRGCT